MLQLTTKWFTNSLAKQSMQNKDFILCHNGERLFIVGYGEITSSGKNTYNYEIKANEKDIVLTSGSNAYLDALTKIVLGATPKSQEKKEKKEGTKEAKQTSKQRVNESLLLTFDDAFDIACKKIESYKDVAKVLGKYDTKDACILALHLIKEANESEKKRIKEAKKSEELKALQGTLEIAIKQGNTSLIEAIKTMIANKENE